MTVFRLFYFSFLSGMHFSQTVAIIQSQVGVIKGVQVLYSETVSFCLQEMNAFIWLDPETE